MPSGLGATDCRGSAHHIFVDDERCDFDPDTDTDTDPDFDSDLDNAVEVARSALGEGLYPSLAEASRRETGTASR